MAALGEKKTPESEVSGSFSKVADGLVVGVGLATSRHWLELTIWLVEGWKTVCLQALVEIG